MSDDLVKWARKIAAQGVCPDILLGLADRIEALEAENARLKIALNYFFLRDIEKPTNWEYGRNLAEELARAALQDEDGE